MFCMDLVVQNALSYDDVEIDVFFESSDEDNDEDNVKKNAGTFLVDISGASVSEDEISRDLVRISEALEVQSFRLSRARGLRDIVEGTRQNEHWSDLLRAEHKKSVSRHLVDLLQPALISDRLDHWEAKKKWCSLRDFEEHCGGASVTVARLMAPHDMGKAHCVTVKVRSYLRHCLLFRGDFPLYVFDHEAPSGPLRQHYDPPPLDVFLRDLFDARRYPPSFPREIFGVFHPYEWMLLGPAGTGSAVHKDPLYTSAWNALLCGRKHWAIFPPHVAVEELKKGADTESPMIWFLDVLPMLRNKPHLGLIEITQDAGDIVFLPEGWWHAVINLDFTVAVTHNAVLEDTLPSLLPRLKETHKDFVEAYQQHIQQQQKTSE